MTLAFVAKKRMRIAGVSWENVKNEPDDNY